MRAAAALPLGSVVVADEQTAGQGRHGHSWHSEPDAGIYCSIVLDPAPVLTLALGLATVEAIAEATGLACDLRWPNDVMLDDKKVRRHPGATGRRQSHRRHRHQREPHRVSRRTCRGSHFAAHRTPAASSRREAF